jgi:hypothetical protein
MAKFLNSIPSGSSGATPGERRFAERLKQFLEDDYLCWFNVPVGPLRQYPDFVILHPRRGLWVLEVKDWKRETIGSLTNLSVEIHTPQGGLKTVANPIEQARQYCMTVVNKLAADPQLQHLDGAHQGKLCFPFAYAAVFTNISRRQIDEVMTEEEQELVLPPRLVLYQDEMTESTPPDHFQERLWQMFHYRFGQPLSLPQIERVRWHLFPEIRITSVQQDFFSDNSSHSAAETLPDIVRVMDMQQEQLARSLGDGHRVIHGVAGSGKTLILGFRCLHLAKLLHKPILVLCFNITLAARLRSFVAERGLEAKVRVHHFHEWCGRQLQAYHVPCQPGDTPVYERQVSSVIAGVDRGLIPRAQYGALMIDEGHDFEPHWLKLVTQMVDPVSDSLLLLYDDAQSIYRKKNSLKFTLSSVGVKAQGRTTILRLNYRNTREILSFASDFTSAFLKPCDDGNEDHIPILQPESAGVTGPRPHFQMLSSFSKETAWVTQCVEGWLEQGVPPQEIALLTLRQTDGKRLHENLQKAQLPSLWLGTHQGKASYDPRQPKVAILSAQSSKGLEFTHVVVFGVGNIRAEEHEIPQSARLLYVAMTRARHSLTLTASRDNAFTAHLTALTA